MLMTAIASHMTTTPVRPAGFAPLEVTMAVSGMPRAIEVMASFIEGV